MSEEKLNEIKGSNIPTPKQIEQVKGDELTNENIGEILDSSDKFAVVLNNIEELFKEKRRIITEKDREDPIKDVDDVEELVTNASEELNLGYLNFKQIEEICDKYMSKDIPGLVVGIFVLSKNYSLYGAQRTLDYIEKPNWKASRFIHNNTFFQHYHHDKFGDYKLTEGENIDPACKMFHLYIQNAEKDIEQEEGNKKESLERQIQVLKQRYKENLPRYLLDRIKDAVSELNTYGIKYIFSKKDSEKIENSLRWIREYITGLEKIGVGTKELEELKKFEEDTNR